jgi:hypothetical protein
VVAVVVVVSIVVGVAEGSGMTRGEAFQKAAQVTTPETVAAALQQAYRDGRKAAWDAVLVEVLAVVMCLFMLTLGVAVIIAGQQRRLEEQRMHTERVLKAVEFNCLPHRRF